MVLLYQKVAVMTATERPSTISGRLRATVYDNQQLKTTAQQIQRRRYRVSVAVGSLIEILIKTVPLTVKMPVRPIRPKPTLVCVDVEVAIQMVTTMDYQTAKISVRPIQPKLSLGAVAVEVAMSTLMGMRYQTAKMPVLLIRRISNATTVQASSMVAISSIVVAAASSLLTLISTAAWTANDSQMVLTCQGVAVTTKTLRRSTMFEIVHVSAKGKT
jgi:hypothetical protein